MHRCRQCCVGTELVDWQMQQSSCVHSRIQAVGMWQALLEEGILNHGECCRVYIVSSGRPCAAVFAPLLCSVQPFPVCPAVDQEQSFQDKYLFYRFLEDEREDAPPLSEEERKQSQEELQDTLQLLSQIGPDAHMRMILRKQYEF